MQFHVCCNFSAFLGGRFLQSNYVSRCFLGEAIKSEGISFEILQCSIPFCSPQLVFCVIIERQTGSDNFVAKTSVVCAEIV